MKHIGNIVIGTPLVPWWELVCTQEHPATEVIEECEQTLFTQERNLAKILKEIGAVKSVSEVRRNRPDLYKDFVDLDCFWLKWGKKRFWVIIGE